MEEVEVSTSFFIVECCLFSCVSICKSTLNTLFVWVLWVEQRRKFVSKFVTNLLPNFSSNIVPLVGDIFVNMEISTICRKDRISKQNEVTISIRLYHNYETRRVSSGLKIDADYWDFENNCLKNDVPNRVHLQYILDEQIQKLRKKELEYKIQGKEYSIDDILGVSRKSVTTIAVYFQKVIDELTSLGRLNTRDKYKFTFSSLSKFKSLDIPFTKIDVQFLREYEIFLRKIGQADNSIATKFSCLKALYNKALDEELFVCEKNPFKKIKVGTLWKSTRKRAITKEEIHQLTNLNLAALSKYPKPYLEFARDIFMFSYLTAGINFKDIASLRCCDVENNRIYYTRNKTKKNLTFQLLPEALNIIGKYLKDDKEGGDYIFPILDKRLHVTEQQKFDRIQKVRAEVNKSLRLISEAMGLKHNLTTYVARHSFATILKNSGVNVALISEALGHSDLATTQIYLDSFENEQVDAAMSNLL
ncbi:site-specific integrase [Odoribacter lunatus]|uniref:site-specific integrase n=1 Tax=Odoribacter lunatus TaxID=2941335 RepID=UPI00203A9280|nr:site-specific integrase [Odoribacter lunatus]